MTTTSTTTPTASAYARSTRTASRRIGDQTVVIDLAGRVVYGLNVAAGAIWDAVAQPGTSADVSQRVGPSGNGEIVERVVTTFLARLCELGLVQRAEAGDHGPATAHAEPVPFGTPEILWQEPLTSFAQSCAQIAGTGFPCDPSPVT